MPALKPSLKRFLSLLCVAVLGAECGMAQQEIKPPTTWWPDPSTGLMWAGQSYGPYDPNHPLRGRQGFTWQQANEYCSSLRLGGFPAWRLPTVDEVMAATVVRNISDPIPNTMGETKHMAEMDIRASQVPTPHLIFKGGVDTHPCARCWDGSQVIWTATREGEKAKSVTFLGGNKLYSDPITDQSHAAICTRTMEPGLVQIAKDAQVTHTIPDVQTLKAFIPLNKARLAFQAGQYQESVTQAQSALALKADPVTAYWGIGISYGMLGKWDEAIANLNSALQLDKKNKIFKSALKWAKDGQKAAEKGQAPENKAPVWN